MLKTKKRSVIQVLNPWIIRKLYVQVLDRQIFQRKSFTGLASQNQVFDRLREKLCGVAIIFEMLCSVKIVVVVCRTWRAIFKTTTSIYLKIPQLQQQRNVAVDESLIAHQVEKCLSECLIIIMHRSIGLVGFKPN